MNKVIGIFGMQGTGKTSYAIQYIQRALITKEYFSIWIFSPIMIQDSNDLFLQYFPNFKKNEPYRYSIFKIIDIDREMLFKYQYLEGKKLLCIDEVDLFFNIASRKEDFQLLCTLRNKFQSLIGRLKIKL
jgi:hypothetical protein